MQAACAFTEHKVRAILWRVSRELEDLLQDDPGALADPDIRAGLCGAVAGLFQAQARSRGAGTLGRHDFASDGSGARRSARPTDHGAAFAATAAHFAGTERPAVLVINPGSTSTKVAWFVGTLPKHTRRGAPHSGRQSTHRRAQRWEILAWMRQHDLRLSDLQGIACRGGVHSAGGVGHVPCGSRKCSHDLENYRYFARIEPFHFHGGAISPDDENRAAFSLP